MAMAMTKNCIKIGKLSEVNGVEAVIVTETVKEKK